ncbi:hypothetical protein PZN02_003510 [Sinorhizobium garamanticum]|uniref:Uncharacterized protein n=1 Tax=Sinorhizobium garamanticum TaxID=680247 RepID=A0ABY8D8E5_9HYPH|nr:hypothetical protein [Sinorhizobium garamanticum]WEX87151.1 hypothetical protein PZN02_003510 [Sinorhizobium garamanticum]
MDADLTELFMGIGAALLVLVTLVAIAPEVGAPTDAIAISVASAS